MINPLNNQRERTVRRVLNVPKSSQRERGDEKRRRLKEGEKENHPRNPRKKRKKTLEKKEEMRKDS